MKPQWSGASVAGGETLSEIQTITVEDTTAPVFDELPSVTLPASGSVTVVSADNLGVATAQDIVDGELTASIVSADTLASGQHDVVWQVVDAQGNAVTATQSLVIEPLANLGVNSFAELGDSATVDVRLSGEAAAYPVTVTLALNSDATGHTAANVDVVIESGVSGSYTFELLNDGTLAAGSEIAMEIVSATNAVVGTKTVHTTTALQGNEAPIVGLVLTADGVPSTVITKGQESAVVLTAMFAILTVMIHTRLSGTWVRYWILKAMLMLQPLNLMLIA